MAELVVHPVARRCCAAAAAAGCTAVDGVGMLVHQAAIAFEAWTGVDAPPVEAMAARPGRAAESGFRYRAEDRARDRADAGRRPPPDDAARRPRMALQGTLDTFELPDVLRLLASTRKSGRLLLRSDRGDGDVWLADGQVVGVEAAGAPDVDRRRGLFELLRAHEGAFAFEPGDEPPTPGRPTDVEPLLAAPRRSSPSGGRSRRSCRRSTPGSASTPELAGAEVTVDAATWRLVATIGSGLTVGELGEVLGLTEVAVSPPRPRPRAPRPRRRHAPPPAHAAADVPAPDVGRAPAPEPSRRSSRAAVRRRRAGPRPPRAEPEPAGRRTTCVEPHAAIADPLFASLPRRRSSAGADPAEADEVARQLAMLSPRAAQAVAAAAAADTDAEREAALDAVDDGDEPINRGLLLKFLSSVKS